MRVMAIEDVLVTKLMATSEHHRFVVLEGLEILPSHTDPPEGGAKRESRVRVVTNTGSAAEAGG